MFQNENIKKSRDYHMGGIFLISQDYLKCKKKKKNLPSYLWTQINSIQNKNYGKLMKYHILTTRKIHNLNFYNVQ